MKRIFFIFIVWVFSNLIYACNPQEFLNWVPFWSETDTKVSGELKVYPVHIDSMYLGYIIDGQKTSEGRLNLPDYNAMVPGDLIFFYDDDGNTAVCTVDRITCYPTFEKMLVSEGVYNMLPQINPETNSSVEMVAKGVIIYDSFPGYKEGVKVYGAIAFTIHYDGDELSEDCLEISMKES
ncbi:MAG: ASCH domain-containing protein [Simkaniaceae bacterium]